MSQPPPPQQQQQTPKEEREQQSKSTQPDLILQSTMTTTAKSQSTRNLLPTIPSLEINQGTVSCPSLRAEISSLSLDDAPSSPSLTPLTPHRNRSHAIDLMGLDLSCLKCNDDVSTGEHYLKAGQCKLLHPPHHRKMSSSSCVAFAVEAALAEQDEAAMSEKAADDDDDNDDDEDSEIFGSDDFTSSCASDLESETSRVDITNRDDDFSFFQEYSCDCLDASSFIAKSKSNRDDDDDDDEDTNSHPTTTDTGTPNGNGDKKVANPLPPLPSNIPKTPRKDTQGLDVSKVSADLSDLSPVSIADTNIPILHGNTTANTAA